MTCKGCAERARIVDTVRDALSGDPYEGLDDRTIGERAARVIRERDEARLALENVRMLAMRMRRKPEQRENAEHLLRFCESAGVVGSVLRATPPATSRPPTP